MPEAPSQSEPASDWLDWERALRIVDHDLGLLRHLVKVFLAQFEHACTELSEAGTSGDWPAVRRRSHQLAGAAGAIGAVALDAAARHAELAASAVLAPSGAADVAGKKPAPAATVALQQDAQGALQALVARLSATMAGAEAWLAASAS